jgi:hypothetical protein
LRPQHHPDHSLSLYNPTEALNWRHDKKSPAANICEAIRLYHELLPLLCLEGTYLHSIAAGPNGVDYVISSCNDFQQTHLMKASPFNKPSSSSVLWVIDTVQEHLTGFQVLSDHGLHNMATLMI